MKWRLACQSSVFGTDGPTRIGRVNTRHFWKVTSFLGSKPREYQRITLLRRDLDEEVEFITIMEFNRIEDVITFQGRDYERCYVPDAARRVLKRWDERSAHFEIIVGGSKDEQAAR
jgi:hypothetical protein